MIHGRKALGPPCPLVTRGRFCSRLIGRECALPAKAHVFVHRADVRAGQAVGTPFHSLLCLIGSGCPEEKGTETSRFDFAVCFVGSGCQRGRLPRRVPNALAPVHEIEANYKSKLFGDIS